MIESVFRWLSPPQPLIQKNFLFGTRFQFSVVCLVNFELLNPSHRRLWKNYFRWRLPLTGRMILGNTLAFFHNRKKQSAKILAGEKKKMLDLVLNAQQPFVEASFISVRDL